MTWAARLRERRGTRARRRPKQDSRYRTPAWVTDDCPTRRVDCGHLLGARDAVHLLLLRGCGGASCTGGLDEPAASRRSPRPSPPQRAARRRRIGSRTCPAAPGGSRGAERVDPPVRLQPVCARTTGLHACRTWNAAPGRVTPVSAGPPARVARGACRTRIAALARAALPTGRAAPTAPPSRRDARSRARRAAPTPTAVAVHAIPRSSCAIEREGTTPSSFTARRCASPTRRGRWSMRSRRSPRGWSTRRPDGSRGMQRWRWRSWTRRRRLA